MTKPQAYPMLRLDSFVQEILANPLTKLPAKFSDFFIVNGVLDARIFLKNTHGFCEWKDGQNVYEAWESSNSGYQQEVESYRVEIDYDRPIYDHYKLDGIILDVGGGGGDCSRVSTRNNEVHFDRSVYKRNTRNTVCKETSLPLSLKPSEFYCCNSRVSSVHC